MELEKSSVRNYLSKMTTNQAILLKNSNVLNKDIRKLHNTGEKILTESGISFTETVKRYYPNGDFASYIIGYAKQYTRINIQINNPGGYYYG